RPLRLGTIKSNIGHTQAAAGVAGVIKMVLAMQHDVLPRTLHVEEPTPHADWSSGALALLAEAVPWPRGARRRRAGISSFGISGTNAHVVVEEAPPAPAAADGEQAPVPASAPALAEAGRDGTASAAAGPAEPGLATADVAWVLSAREPRALREQAARLRAHLAGDPRADLADVGYTLATCRTAMTERAVVVGDDRAVLLRALGTLAAEPDWP